MQRKGKGDYVYSGVVQPTMNCFSCFLNELNIFRLKR
nr:MAG TPA: hypothetical protein [Caudoviricetes sp.]